MKANVEPFFSSKSFSFSSLRRGFQKHDASFVPVEHEIKALADEASEALAVIACLCRGVELRHRGSTSENKAQASQSVFRSFEHFCTATIALSLPATVIIVEQDE